MNVFGDNISVRLFHCTNRVNGVFGDNISVRLFQCTNRVDDVVGDDISVRLFPSTTDATKTLLCAFVLSKLDYCNSLLSGSPKHLLDKLQKVQNSAARLVFKALKHKHIKPLLQKLHWLPVVSRIQYEVATLCYNSFTESYPVYLSELLTVYRPSRQLRSISDTRTFRIPFTKTKTFGQRAFSFTGPTEWNSLPYDVRHSVSTSSFKQALKTHLFKSAYN